MLQATHKGKYLGQKHHFEGGKNSESSKKSGRNNAFLLFSTEKQGRNKGMDGGKFSEHWPKYSPLTT